MIQITPELAIDEQELQYRPLYSSGPGGQNVNKNMTAVQLRFNIVQCHSLPHDVQQRLIFLAGSKVNSEYELLITARRHRSQERNKREALERLVLLIQKASRRQKPRLKRRRSHAENQSRLNQKKKRGDTKSLRRRIDY